MPPCAISPREANLLGSAQTGIPRCHQILHTSISTSPRFSAAQPSPTFAHVSCVPIPILGASPYFHVRISQHSRHGRTRPLGDHLPKSFLVRSSHISLFTGCG